MSAVLEQLAQRAEEAEREAARLRKMHEVVQELGEDGLAELLDLYGARAAAPAKPIGYGSGKPLSRGSKPGAPRGREALRIIVRERPGIWTLKELRAEMEQRGWFTSASGLEAAAKRLCDLNGEGKRIGKGRYVFPADFESEGAIESDASDGALIPFTPLALSS